MNRLDRENASQIGYRCSGFSPHMDIHARFAEAQSKVCGLIMILHPRPEAGLGMASPDQGSVVCGAKGSTTAQKIDRFQYRSLAGSIVARNDIDPGMKEQRRLFETAEILYPEFCYQRYRRRSVLLQNNLCLPIAASALRHTGRDYCRRSE